MIPSIFSSSCPTRLYGQLTRQRVPVSFAYMSKSVSTVAQSNVLYSVVDTDGNTARDTMQVGLFTK